MHAFASAMIVATALAQASNESARDVLAADAPPAAIVTRQMEFQLPFKTAPADDKEKAPVEVRLFVSSDAGRSWKTHSRVRPDQGHFKFAAPKDGQYGFVIRTVDRRGALWPNTKPKPEMLVTVDTHPPKIELTAEWNAAGHVTAAWKVTDPTLKPESLKLQYRMSVTEPWQAVAIATPSTEQPSQQAGKATWWPKSTKGPLLVRFEAHDKAGNPGVAQRTLKLPMPEQQQQVAAGVSKPKEKPQDDRDRVVPVPPVKPVETPKVNVAAKKQLPAKDHFAEPNGTVGNALRGVPEDRVDVGRQFAERHGGRSLRVAESPPVARRAILPKPPTRRAIPACRVKLTSTARQNGRMTIRWQTSGASTLSKTIHIAYSNTAKGPWLPVALNQKDDGHHVWQYDRSVPDQVFLMIEVIDRAGSRSHFITPEPLWLRPKASGMPHTGQAPAEYRFF